MTKMLLRIVLLMSVAVILSMVNLTRAARHSSRDFPRNPTNDWTIRNKQRSDSSWRSNSRRQQQKLKKPIPVRERKPNIIVIITDDQDIELGSMKHMPKTLRILQDEGVHFPNAYVTTPMCCPSRSSILTGMYVHNHNVFTNNDNCSSLYWQQTHEQKTFATYLNNAGYRTGYFGKYLNEYNGTYIPPGWREWAALIRNSRFYNYTVTVNGKKIKHGDDYHKDYYPDLITNDSLTFLRESKHYFGNKPVMMVLSYPSPHGPEDAAPQYQHLFLNNTDHRTPNWNYAPNPDKQWILRHTGKMEPIHIKFTDMLQTKRLQTLQSIDNSLERIYNELQNLKELDNTYIIYLSDHGYHLGQFGLVKGKAMPFEFDVKIPFYIRGPKVPSGIKIPNIVLNLDLAPTLLDIAGVDIPDHMDGKSIYKLLLEANELSLIGRRSINMELRRKKTWRETFLIESSGRRSAGKDHYIYPGGMLHGRIPNSYQNTALTKDQKLSYLCKDPQYKSPCQFGQIWECSHDGDRWRIHKCRSSERNHHKHNCVCPEDNKSVRLDTAEKNAQRAFLRDHVKKEFKPKFIGARHSRSIETRETIETLNNDDNDEDYEQYRDSVDDDIEDDLSEEDFDTESIYQLHPLLVAMKDDEDDIHEMKNDSNTYVNDNIDFLEDLRWDEGSSLVSEQILIPGVSEHTIEKATEQSEVDHKITERSLKKMVYQKQIECSVSNATINCSDVVYQDPIAWRENKDSIDEQIKEYKSKLQDLKKLRLHLKKSRPIPSKILPTVESDQYPNMYNNEERRILAKPTKDKQHHPKRFCPCDPPFGESPRRSFRDEYREERRRIKEERLRFKERKNKKKAKYINTTCNAEKMNCFTHDNDHWKVPPLWTYGPFCFCQNANNNTYWCIRTINETHNFLYCEFITGYLLYFDLNQDPYQMHNIVNNLSIELKIQLHNQLMKLKFCQGAKECTVRTRPLHYDSETRSKSYESDVAAARISKHSSRPWKNEHQLPQKSRRQNG